MESPELPYAGCWIRVWAAVIDTALVSVLILPVLTAIYGESYWDSTSILHGPVDFLLSWVAPAVAVVLFWIARQATPGKMAISARIVDAKTGGKATTRQLVIRYLGYYVSLLPFGLAMLWVAFDRRKQGWHDKIAGTVVVRKSRGGKEPVRFDGG